MLSKCAFECMSTVEDRKQGRQKLYAPCWAFLIHGQTWLNKTNEFREKKAGGSSVAVGV